MLATLGRLRRRQANRCPAQRRPPQPPPRLVPSQAALRRGADPALARRLQGTLAALAKALVGQPGDVAQVLGVVAEDNRISLCLDQARAGVPAPFQRGGPEGRWWVLAPAPTSQPDPDAEVLLPTLVSVGTTPAGAQVLLNLEASGPSACSGPPGPG